MVSVSLSEQYSKPNGGFSSSPDMHIYSSIMQELAAKLLINYQYPTHRRLAMKEMLILSVGMVDVTEAISCTRQNTRHKLLTALVNQMGLLVSSHQERDRPFHHKQTLLRPSAALIHICSSGNCSKRPPDMGSPHLVGNLIPLPA